MIYVFSTPDRIARCLSGDDEPPPAPFEQVAAFEEEDAEEAWRLLHELGWEPSAV